jgi:hypothetical protein
MLIIPKAFTSISRYRKLVNLAALAVICSSLECYGEGIITINFDGPPPPSDLTPTVTQYLESGILFNPLPSTGSFQRWPSGNLFGPYDGSAYIMAGRANAVGFSSTNGTLLNLVSVDLSEGGLSFTPHPLTVNFIGYRQDGTTVTTNFLTDGIIDQTGPLADFQTFHFDSQFNNLIRVEIPNSGWALDNLVVASVIPEPSYLVLLGLGGSFLFMPLARKSRSRALRRP